MKKVIYLLIILFTLGLLSQCSNQVPDSIDLSGEWTVKLDSGNVGISEKWFNNIHPEKISLPGCLSEGKIGEKPGPDTKWWVPLNLSLRHPSLAKYAKADSNFKLVQYLMPEHYYIGAAWYNKEIEIPESFEGKEIQLSLERCHWESTVWLDGKNLGSNQSLAAPHQYDLSGFKPGKHILSIRIDNGKVVELGAMAHSVSDQTQGAWNGIVGEIALKANDKVFIENTQVYPDIYTKNVKLTVKLSNPNKIKGNIEVIADAKGYNNGKTHNPDKNTNTFELNGQESQTIAFEYALGADAKLWDEFDPNLYKLNVSIYGDNFKDDFETSFGMRKISYMGSHFYVNDTLTYLRGNVDCAVNPATGYAPMSVERWKEIFQVYKDHGLNHARFHSWCPPKQAFIAADELGIYLAPEVHDWSYISTKEQMEFLDKESITILDYMGNHASFVTLAIGNEMGMDTTYAHNMVNKWKKHDPRRLYTFKISAHHYEDNPSNIDFESLARIPDKTQPLGIMHIKQLATWPPSPKVSIFTITKPQTTLDWSDISQFYKRNYNKPLIAHEIAQFCAYPNIPVEKAKYTSYLRPTYLEIAEEQLKERGMYNQIDEFVHASGEWQVAVTKEEFEAVLRTPDLGGFQWLCLSDFTGQNTAPVGFTDAFYDSKPYVTAEETKRFCDASVLLARLPSRVFINDEKFSASMELCHYHKKDINLDDFKAEIIDSEGNVLESRQIKAGTFSQGNVQKLGNIEFDLASVKAPSKYKLVISSAANKLENDYDFWVYAKGKEQDFPQNVMVSEQWNSKTEKALQNGETVLLLPKIGSLKARMPICFTTFFWTAFGEKGGQSSACGITMNNEHPLFNDFPTESHANWHWWELLTQCQPLVLDQFEEEHPWPKEYRALIQPIDSWKLNRKLGLVVEAKVGKGKILICSIDILNDLDNRPVAKQFRKSLIGYMNSTDFNPDTEVSFDVISALFDQSKPEFLTNMQGLPMQ